MNECAVSAGIRSFLSFRSVLAATLVAALLSLSTPRAGTAQGLEQYDYENLGLRGIGVELVYANPTQIEGTLGFGVRADLGFLGPNIRVVPRFAFWSANVEQTAVGDLERQLENVSELPAGSIDLGAIERDFWIVGSDLQWTIPDAQVAPYLGLGLDVYILNDSGAAIDGTFLDDAVITAGVSGVVGLEYELSPTFVLYGDIRGTLVTDASSVALYGGIAYRFGGP